MSKQDRSEVSQKQKAQKEWTFKVIILEKKWYHFTQRYTYSVIYFKLCCIVWWNFCNILTKHI